MSDLRRLYEAATSGPWVAQQAGLEDDNAAIFVEGEGGEFWVSTDLSNPDAELIAAMHSALPYLLDVVDEAGADVEARLAGKDHQSRTRDALDALNAHWSR